MKVRIYERGNTRNGNTPQLLREYNVRNVYESSFYFRPVPTLSAKRCRGILNELFPHFKAEKELLLFENVETGYKWLQELHRNGTILNG